MLTNLADAIAKLDQILGIAAFRISDSQSKHLEDMMVYQSSKAANLEAVN